MKGCVLSMYNYSYFLNNLLTNESKKSTIKMKNNIFAMLSAPDAIPPNPNTAAMIAMMIKITVQRNIIYCFY